MNDLQIFTYGDTSLRTVEKDGELWWVLRDVCNVLGIVKTDKVKTRLDEDERGTALVSTPSGEQIMTIVNEPGLYSLNRGAGKPL